MMYKKLRISLIFSKLVVSKLLISNHRYAQPIYKVRQNPWDMQTIFE